ncbi:MAG: hypothetical protein JXR59_07925 [Desulfuromonadaceae bacterium]|nr:hypothetical protein [Desulfuromonadaceae bacterium]
MAMDHSLRLFGRRYARFLLLAEMATRYMPRFSRWPLISLASRLTSPYNSFCTEIITALGSALELGPRADRHAWVRWRSSHARFVLTIFQYRRMDHDWIRRFVHVEQPLLLEQIVHRGGLILTYHTHHQNTLAALLGVAGATISPIAASAADSPLYSVIGRYIDLINDDSQRQFRGGRYLYTDNLRQVLREARTRLQRGELLLSLCDFHQPSSERAHRFLGCAITPPTGVIRLALECAVPIYLGLLFPREDGRFMLHLAQVQGADLYAVAQEYLDFLAQVVQVAPEAWQGWEWYNRLAPWQPEDGEAEG